MGQQLATRGVATQSCLSCKFRKTRYPNAGRDEVEMLTVFCFGANIHTIFTRKDCFRMRNPLG
jgi:hypothetical protein